MFDLFRSRDKAVRLFLGGLLFLVALSMLVYLIPGAGMSTGNRNDQIVAEIGRDDVITVQDVDKDIQNKVRGKQLPPDVVGIFIPQEIDFMIAERAVIYEAQRMGFQITDAELADTIRSLPQIGTLTPSQYQEFVAQQGFSVAEFENNFRKQSALLALNNLAIEGVIVTPAEVEREYRRGNEKIRLEYVGFSADKLKSELKPTPEELKAYFQSRRASFSAPEVRSFQMIVADPVKIAETLNIPDVQLQQFYDSHKDNFRTPERVKVRHILFDTRNKSKEEVAKIRAKAEDVLKQVKSGADFGKLAEKYSEDPGSAKNGGDLGWVVRGQMVKNFEDTTFSLKPNQISDLVTTEYGFHIVQVLEKQDAHLQPFNDAKGQIAAEMKKQMGNEKMQDLADAARAELAKAPASAQQIASKLNLLFVNAENHKPGETIPEIGTDAQLDGVIQGLKKGDVSQVMQSQNKLAIVVVTNVVPSHPAEYADVEAAVRNQFLQERAFQLVTEKAKKAGELLKTNGGDLKEIAKSLGGEVKSTDAFARGGAAEGLGEAGRLADAFDKPVGGTIGPLNLGSQTIVAKVVEKIEPDMSKLAEQRDTLVQQIKSKKADERSQLFQDGVVTKLVQEGKIKIHKDVMDRLIARYRS